MCRWCVQYPRNESPSILDVPSLSSWVTLDDQNALHWTFIDSNVQSNTLFYPTYFCSNPDTTDKFITFKGWQLSINTETSADSTVTEEKASGPLQFRDLSEVSSVTVQQVCLENQNSTY